MTQLDTAGHPPVVLIGGNGDVGRRLLRLVLEETEHQVIVLSRSGPRKSALPSDRVGFERGDVGDKNAATLIPPGAIVVNLTEATPPALAASVVAGGGVFLETSAAPDYLALLSEIIGSATGPGTAILCVGVAPGLTNLMAAELASIDGVSDVDIGVEMGLGRHYGAGATEWFFQAAGAEYPLIRSGHPEKARPGELRRKFAFAHNERPRLALGYGFAEQYRLASDKALGLATVRSFVAVEPPILTRAFGWLLRSGLGPWVSGHSRGLTGLMARMPGLGKTRTRVMAEGSSANGERLAVVRMTTGDQAEATAAMILATILNLRPPGSMLTGVTTIVDHLDLNQALAVLRRILPETDFDAPRDSLRGS